MNPFAAAWLLVWMPALLAQDQAPTPTPPVVWSPDLASTLAQAKTAHQPTLMFFTAS